MSAPDRLAAIRERFANDRLCCLSSDRCQVCCDAAFLLAELTRLRAEADRAHDLAGRVMALEGEVARLRAALLPFAHFAEMFEAKPLRGQADAVYAIHTGTEWAAAITLPDLRAARRALAPTEGGTHE